MEFLICRWTETGMNEWMTQRKGNTIKGCFHLFAMQRNHRRPPLAPTSTLPIQDDAWLSSKEVQLGVTLRDDDDENNPRWICLLLTTKRNAQTKQSVSKGFFIKSQYEFCLCCCCYGCSCPLLDEWREKYRPRSFPLSSVVVVLWRVRPARHNTRERVQ